VNARAAGPAWWRAALGALAVVVGVFLALRPFASLAVLLVAVVVGLVVTGVGRLAGSASGTRWRRVAGLAYLVAAGLVVAWPAATVHVLAVVVGALLVVDGALDVLAARTERGTHRWNLAVRGAACALLGVVALAWPDVTVLVVAVVFGLRVVLLGWDLLLSGLRGARPHGSRRPRAAPGGQARLVGNVVALGLVVALAVGTVAAHAAEREPDDFYAAPAAVPDAPGRLLRSEAFVSAEVPPGAHAWRILYTTTRDAGVPAVASGLVIVPDGSIGPGARPADVVAWAHGTTGTASRCAPSVLAGGLAAGALDAPDELVARGWAIVATDYVGLGTAGPHPYLVGQAEARSVLDSVRAAHQLAGAALAAPTVVWGHSQGGHAALWTGELAPSYAPDVTIVGVAAIAPASNPPALLDHLPGVSIGDMFAAYVVEGYTSTYPDVTFERYVRPTARTLVHEMAQRCLSEPGVLVSALSSIVLDKPVWRDDPDSGPLRARLAQNVPAGAIEAPVLIAQGGADRLVTPPSQDAYVALRCARGYAVDYRTYPGLDHVPAAERGSPAVADALAWTADRFAGRPAADTCP
jgi:uncharacterized membrane protein HdeD (DUF308 family)/alpha-beta hydrolase superfamily lysophospholipase